MNRIKRKSALYRYLESTGALDKGADAIRLAKRQYYLDYKREYMRAHRKERKEYRFVCNGAEAMTIAQAAKEHAMPQSRFVKQAVLAYIAKVYLVKDRHAVADILRALAQAQNSIQRIERKERSWLHRGSYAALEDVLHGLRRDIEANLKYPPTILDIVRTAISAHPYLKAQLLKMINNDTEIIGPQG
ncbi:MAG: hypothetical protein JST49_05945 [Bacteroidetes bacterium]|nr:hypothetical protein [Bacteroidota bacterium]